MDYTQTKQMHSNIISVAATVIFDLLTEVWMDLLTGLLQIRFLSANFSDCVYAH